MQVILTTNAASAAFGSHSILSFDADGAQVQALVHAGDHDSERLRKIQAAARRLANLQIPTAQLCGHWDEPAQLAFAHGFASAKKMDAVQLAAPSTNLMAQIKHASWLKTQINGAPEDVFPEKFAKDADTWIRAVAPANSVQSRIVAGKDLSDQGYVGIYQVGRGSSRAPALLQLDFNPSGSEQTPVAVALVGKGITFDSGGYSIKETTSMLGMKCDMGGAALVSAALALAIELGLRKRVQLFLCCAENLISGHAYKLGDVLRYRNGTTVEIVNTDAEGRLVLADGLIDAVATGAPLIVDAATLTGAAITALGTDYNAVFSNNTDAAADYLRCARLEGELHWPLPLAPFHQSKCPSSYADTANSRPVKGGGPGGASNAAGFLQRFVPADRQWVHVDLAGAFADSDGPLYAAGGTALGLRTLARALLEA
jgi:PepB aminopeptidase